MKLHYLLSLGLLFLSAESLAITQQSDSLQVKAQAAAARKFVESLSVGAYANACAQFDGSVRGAISVQKLNEIWTALNAQSGVFKRIQSVRPESAIPYTIEYVATVFGNTVLDLKIVLTDSSAIVGFFILPHQEDHAYVPPGYAMPGSYRETDVWVGSGQWRLPGTLTLPRGGGLFSAVVLVHGSGPNDRDETIGPNKPFKDLALGLASQRIAVLRYEKRTKVYASKMLRSKDSITVKEEAIDDALAAVTLLQHTPGIDARKIFVLGHSLGGMLVPRIGIADSSIAGFVVMAGAARPFEDLLLEQMKYIASLDDTITAEKKKQLEKLSQQVLRVKDKSLSLQTDPAELPPGVPPKYWLDLRGYSPAASAATLNRPMLILQGERDYQVTLDDYREWRAFLSGKKNVQFKTYPKLNHLFIPGEGKSTPTEYQTAGHVAEEVVNDIARWIFSP